MFDLFTIALFQLATLFGSAPATLNDSTAPTTQSVDTTVGSGGWGHDIDAPAPTPPTCNSESTVGSGGWGHD